MRRVVKDRLGITPDEMDGGHLPAFAHPQEFVDRYASDESGRFQVYVRPFRDGQRFVFLVPQPAVQTSASTAVQK